MINIPNWIKNQFIYTLAVSSTMISNILISIIGTRLLDVNEYGLVALVKPTIVILSSLFGIGLSQAFNHWRWKKEINKKVLIETTLSSIFISSIFLSNILFITFSLLLDKRDELFNFSGYLTLLILCISFMQNNEMLNIYRVDNIKIKFTLITVIRAFLQIITISIFLFLTRKYTSYIYGLSISELILYFILMKDIGNYRIFIRKDLIKDLVKFGFPNSIVICSSFLLTFSDRYMINIFSNNTSPIAIYDINYLIAGGFITFISRPLNTYIQPYLTKTFYKENFDKSIKVLNNFQYKSIPALFFAALFTIFFGNYLIKIFFTNLYIESNKVIIPLTISFFINSLIIPYHTFLNISGRNKIIVISIISAISINILLNIYLIPAYGILGASLSTLFSSIIEITILIKTSKGYKISKFFYFLLLMLFITLVIIGIFIN